MSSSLVLQSARELQYSSGEGLLHAEWSPAALKWEPKTCKAISVPHLENGLATKPPAPPLESGGGKGQGRCRVEGCNAPLADEKVYYRVRLGLSRRLWRDGGATPVCTIPSDTVTPDRVAFPFRALGRGTSSAPTTPRWPPSPSRAAHVGGANRWAANEGAGGTHRDAGRCPKAPHGPAARKGAHQLAPLAPCSAVVSSSWRSLTRKNGHAATG